MNRAADLRINRMPGITWRWLRLNDRAVKVTSDGTAALPEVSATETFTESGSFSDFAGIAGGSGKAYEEYMEGAEESVFSTTSNKAGESPLKLTFSLEDGAHTQNRYGFDVAPGSKDTVIMDFRSADDATGIAAFQTKIHVAEGATLHFVQIHRAGEGYQVLNDVGAKVEKKGRLEVIQVIFSGKENDIGTQVELLGDDSSYDAEVGYIATHDHVIDLNYITPYVGKRGSSNLNVSGVLCDTAKKIFRGTIDFQRGCEDSTGDENESVLLMDDHVVNQSVPVILCDEENVEGNHGASIGKLDESLMFYLQSRGIAYDDIYEMMAKAKLEAIFRQIPDAATVEELTEYNETRH